jgi:hypothetical protein
MRIKAGDKPEDKTLTVKLLSTRGGEAERQVQLTP